VTLVHQSSFLIHYCRLSCWTFCIVQQENIRGGTKRTREKLMEESQEDDNTHFEVQQETKFHTYDAAQP